MKPRVLYTKEIGQGHPFLKASEIDWTFQSFIQILETPFNPAAIQSEWLFFTSANGVNSLLSRWLPSRFKIACLGEATAKAFDGILTPDFIGTGSVEDLSTAFKEQLQDQRVTFIEGNLNKRTIAEALPKEKCAYVQTYETHLLPNSVNPHDVYFFTSPSNVDGFLLKNEIDSTSKIIAIGTTTQAHLKDLGFQASVPNSYMHSDQLDAIKAAIRS